jgi:hypothetical protein
LRDTTSNGGTPSRIPGLPFDDRSGRLRYQEHGYGKVWYHQHVYAVLQFHRCRNGTC